MFHSNHPEIDPLEARPCPHMVVPLSQLADGTARGLIKWLAEQHIEHCPQCSASLKGLRALRERLRQLGLPAPTTVEAAVADTPPLSEPKDGLNPARRATLEAAWAHIEAERIRSTGE